MPMRLGTEMPSLEGATHWMNASEAPVLESGKVTLVHFWAVSCHICHETMNDVIAIRDKYQDKGLQTVAIHMPRYEEDTNLERVKRDIAEYAITQPVGVDNEHRIANRFENEYVPAFFVFGTDGKLKFRAAGDKGFQKVEPKIREALGLPEVGGNE
ncbi:thioredoxin-like domain-containing protein [Alicyclobacillus pomorum]|uniref:thioredoxin-like domain-containing protein n=1 Tax=Alicyclobacillus pomorum TaxID=204470 RepID=UPI000478AA62|nr:thioredoxin-like domain-containing protein [Alicyclobacillus pomorum]